MNFLHSGNTVVEDDNFPGKVCDCDSAKYCSFKLNKTLLGRKIVVLCQVADPRTYNLITKVTDQLQIPEQ